MAGETLALKFVPISDRFKVDREYKNYAGLEAILTNSTAHPYGIPSVHFRGDIKIGSRIFDTIGLKFLEGDFNSKMEEEYIKCLGRFGIIFSFKLSLEINCVLSEEISRNICFS